MLTRTSSHLGQPGFRVARLMALLGTLVILSASASGAAVTEQGSRPIPAPPKPTIVLVHGAWADNSSWSAIAKRLQADGYPVRVPPVTLRSLGDDARNLALFVSTITGPVVLVGHSYGGGVITNMPVDPDVKALVFVNGFAPAEGEALVALSGPDSALSVTDPTSVFDFVPYTGGPAGDVELYLKQSIFRTAFANDLSSDQADVLWATQRPVSGSAGNEASGAPAWSSVPSWYALGTRDLVIPPSAQQAMAERAHSTIVKVRAGHLSPISRPGAVTDVIEMAASSPTG
jgi:pimeloyl-ACP methyl ester carboxylesterase